ncbi:unnamed protein product [Prorocentrum cordatum]|uniref:Uncharacterized protein n=1 Tax=Prorocentrum cordatum TaxID=2364126 RepID=A0ABN9XJT7_9DINO|nr:unnamed protein product [Polarella glacialis]
MLPTTSAVEDAGEVPSSSPVPAFEDDLACPPGLGSPQSSDSGKDDHKKHQIGLAGPPGLPLPQPTQVAARRKASSSPVGSMSEPEPEVKAEAENEESAATKRFCVWCGKRVPPKLVSARFCVFCGGVHSGEGAGAPNHGKPNQPKPPQARVAATGAALQAEARQRVAAALAEQSAAMMVWSQSQAAALAFGDGYFGKEEVGISRAALYGSLSDPVFLPVNDAKPSSEAWGDGSSFGADPFEEGAEDMLWAHRWQRSLTSPAKMQYTNDAVTPAMLYQMQVSSGWN